MHYIEIQLAFFISRYVNLIAEDIVRDLTEMGTANSKKVTPNGKQDSWSNPYEIMFCALNSYQCYEI